jgi:TATA-binding protein-associated factor Taf7
MRTHRFGRKIKLPATIAIKHQIRMLMAQDEVKKAEAKLIDQSARRTARDDRLPLSDMATRSRKICLATMTCSSS